MDELINLVALWWKKMEGVQAIDRGGMCAGVADGALRDPGAGRLHGPRCKGTYTYAAAAGDLTDRRPLPSLGPSPSDLFATMIFVGMPQRKTPPIIHRFGTMGT
jgi:hypothetical protein